MKNKIKTLLVIAASAALTGCSFTPSTGNQGSNASLPDTGVVTSDEAPAIEGLYADALENTEDLENLDDGDSSQGESQDSSQESSEEASLPEESSQEEEESEPEESQETSEESEPEEETPIEDLVSSYHVDYHYDFGLKASVSGVTVLDFSESEAYSLTYVNDEDGLFLDMSLTHTYKDNAYSYGSETIRAVYQDEVLYVSSDVTSGEYDWGEDKTAYRIESEEIYEEFGDYFRYTYDDLLLDTSSKESSYELLSQLIAAENVEVSDAQGSVVTLTITEEGVTTVLSFDTALSLFTGASIDESEALKASLESMRNNDQVSIDEALSKTTIAFSYNSSEAAKLSEEEIGEYAVDYFSFHHHNDHEGYDEEGGHHDGHGHDHDGWGEKDDHQHGEESSEGESEYDPWGDWDDWSDWDEGEDDSEPSEPEDPWGDYWGDGWGEGSEEESSSAHGRR